MKGIIADCMEKLVIEKKGRNKWEQILEKSGLDKNIYFLPTQDIDDNMVIKVVGSVCTVLGKSLSEVANAFGIYWVNYYAPKIYYSYYGNAKTAKEFLLRMDEVHQQVTRRIANAHPPRFDYEQPDDDTLIMIYKSERNLLDFVIGLVKGVGKYFNEDLKITKIGENKIKIKFL
ncbi:MAG: hypothetical protein GY795_29350 [Desulfobacterales bacterium]|nr:hypothetical protein [Desulfobacterales bacterium]